VQYYSSEKIVSRLGRQQIEHRINRRYLMTTTAEVVELASGSRIRTRTMDVSRGGCFVDTLLPLPVRSRVRVFLSKGGESLHADGTVTYCQPGLGMGVAFTNVIPEHQPVLEGWLIEACRERPADFGVLPKYAKQEEKESADRDRSTVRKLIHLLVARGVLTEGDAAALLREPTAL